ncbi:MAG: hypothetical protein IJ736_16015 [Firmicutes bacterium]|nr:hypothetical protein [Bacillota bacterium]
MAKNIYEEVSDINSPEMYETMYIMYTMMYDLYEVYDLAYFGSNISYIVCTIENISVNHKKICQRGFDTGIFFSG